MYILIIKHNFSFLSYDHLHNNQQTTELPSLRSNPLSDGMLKPDSEAVNPAESENFYVNIESRTDAFLIPRRKLG